MCSYFSGRVVQPRDTAPTSFLGSLCADKVVGSPGSKSKDLASRSSSTLDGRLGWACNMQAIIFQFIASCILLVVAIVMVLARLIRGERF